MYIPKVKKPHILSYKGIMNQSKVIDWLCRKEGILLDEPKAEDWSAWRNYKSNKDVWIENQERSMSQHLESCCGCSFCEPDEKE
jgi:hypothetical protein